MYVGFLNWAFRNESDQYPKCMVIYFFDAPRPNVCMHDSIYAFGTTKCGIHEIK